MSCVPTCCAEKDAASLRVLVPQLDETVASPDGGTFYRNQPDPFKAVRVIKGKIRHTSPSTQTPRVFVVGSQIKIYG